MKGRLIPGLGIVDVETQLQVVPARRQGTGDGKAQAWVRRLDNNFCRIGGWLPRLTTDLSAATMASSTSLTSSFIPPNSGNGQGIRRKDLPDRSARHSAQARCGAALTEDRATWVELFLEETVHLAFATCGCSRSHAEGFAYRANGQSRPTVSSNGQIPCPRRQRSPSPCSTWLEPHARAPSDPVFPGTLPAADRGDA
jgi:hypothetical protein